MIGVPNQTSLNVFVVDLEDALSPPTPKSTSPTRRTQVPRTPPCTVRIANRYLGAP